MEGSVVSARGDAVAGSAEGAEGADGAVLLVAAAAAGGLKLGPDGMHCCGGHIVSRLGTVGSSMAIGSTQDSPSATVRSSVSSVVRASL